MRKTLRILLAVVLLITISGMLILKQAKFGQLPKGERLERIKNSPNYRNGEFKNIHNTPVVTAEKNRFQLMLDFMFRKKINLSPVNELPVVKNNLNDLNPEEDILVWFGHSSYFMQIKGKTFLIDPVFSDYASPFSFINKAFKGTSNFKAEDLPVIDYLVITHDHWDHLDYQTVLDLKHKVKKVICGLGVGQHFEYWGYDSNRINELDWYEGINLGKDWRMTATPARHYSGRGFTGNQTLWVSFALQTPGFNVYIGGDSGYDQFYKEIGYKYGPFDLAILEQGQYDQNWNLIHILPDQVFDAAKELKAGSILPVHNSRFALANHSWMEPLDKIVENHKAYGIKTLTPEIGEIVFVHDTTQTFTKWWKETK